MKIGSLDRPDRLPVQVADAIRKEILEGKLKPGDRLPTEQYLAQNFNVSRNVIREAMAQLRSEHLVRSRQGLGTIVCSDVVEPASHFDETTTYSYGQVYELRLGVEVLAAELAAVRATQCQIEALRKSVDLMWDAERWEAKGVDLDLGFHVAIAEATGNPLIVEATSFIAAKMRAAIVETRARSGSAVGEVKRLTIEEHAAICDALQSRDAKAAAKATIAHIRNAAHRLGYDVRGDKLAGGIIL